MAGPVIYVSKVIRLPLLDVNGDAIGRVDDVVLAPAREGEPPGVTGFVATVQRRHIFVNAGRVGEVGAVGVRLHSGAVDLRRFQLRQGELLAADMLFNRRVGGEMANDLGLRRSTTRLRGWEVATVALRSPGGLRRRRASRVVQWEEVPSLFDAGPVAKEIAEFRQMHPSDIARRLRNLPLHRRRQLAAAMDDDRLADTLEQLPEDEQLRIVEGLDQERVAHVLEEMSPDDAADLLGEMPGEQQRQLLDAMEPDEADDLRRLLRYGEDTAGGLMTPEPVIVAPTVTVAEALARLRDPELPVALASQVFVTRPPTETPTGRFLGSVGFQRLLREPPGLEVERCVEDAPESVMPDVPAQTVAERLAAYDLVAVAVCDSSGSLVGAVTVDDVLDHSLPGDWRRRP